MYFFGKRKEEDVSFYFRILLGNKKTEESAEKIGHSFYRGSGFFYLCETQFQNQSQRSRSQAQNFPRIPV